MDNIKQNIVELNRFFKDIQERDRNLLLNQLEKCQRNRM